MRTGVSFILFALALAAQAASAETIRLPSPTGQHKVGRRLVRWVDPARTEGLSSRPGDRREVVVWFWYPSSEVAGATSAPYVDQLEKLGLPKDAVSIARSAQGTALTEPPLDDEPVRFPLILFSPGAETIPALYSSLCEELASRGFVVAAVDHPYDDLAVLLSDGRVAKEAKQPSGGEELLRYERERVSVRSQDLRFVLDQLERVADGRIKDPFQGRLDLSHIGALGHSVGGITAAELCKKDSRVTACANMDGVVSALPAYPEDTPQGLERPFLFLEKPLPVMKGEKPEDAQRRLAFLRGRGNALLSGVRTGTSYRVTITGATHATFSDEEFLTSKAGKRPGELLALVRSYLDAFFGENLKGETKTALEVPPLDSAVRIQAFAPK